MGEFIFAGLLVIACIGWGVTNALNARNNLREANALEVLDRISTKVDDKARSVINRYFELRKAKEVGRDPGDKTVLDDVTEYQREMQRQRLNLLDSQPDDGVADQGFVGEAPIPGMEVEG